MILMPVLELRKSDLENKERPVEFYRYDIDGTKVWFEQHLNTGHIYAVYVSLNSTYFSGYNIYVTCDDDQLFYPVDIKISMNHREFHIDSVKGLIAQLSMLANIADTIDALFKDSEHHDLWVAKHA